MIINDNGIDREATPEEVTAWEEAQAETKAAEKKVAAIKKKKEAILEKLGITPEELLTLLS